MNKIIFTCNPNSFDMCFDELKQIFPKGKLTKRLHEGVGCFEMIEDFDIASEKIKSFGSVFLLHIFPVLFIGKTNDADEIVNKTVTLLDSTVPCSIQIRNINSDLEILDKFIDRIHDINALIDVKNPVQVISCLICGDEIFAGVSYAKQNISNWCGGMIRFSKEYETISRAEFKLLEVFETFDVEITQGGNALDLGASPGGWTKVLVEKGLSVVCVDPAELDERVLGYKGVTHYKMSAQDFMQNNSEKFSLIVNDMRMDVYESARIMNSMSNMLEDNGKIIMTLKLPKVNQKKMTKKGIDIIKSKYHILKAKQLFHNRSEITLYCEKDKLIIENSIYNNEVTL